MREAFELRIKANLNAVCVAVDPDVVAQAKGQNKAGVKRQILRHTITKKKINTH